MRAPVPAACALVVALVAGGCAGPSRTEGDYRAKAAATLDQVRSAVETAQLGVAGGGRHGLPSAYVSVLLAEAEADAVAADGTFASVQPPDAAADAVRARVGAVVDEAVDALADLRIRSRRGDLADLPAELPALRRLSRRLDALASDLGG